MIFYFDPPQNVWFHMKDCNLDLDIIFIDEDQEVISVKHGKPNDESKIEENNVAYVVEINSKSGVKKGDTLEFEDDEDVPVMKVLFPDGSEQMPLYGGERIVSRRETKILIKKAKLAQLNKGNDEKYEKCCKALGKYIFKVFKKQDNRDPEYVNAPN